MSSRRSRSGGTRIGTTFEAEVEILAEAAALDLALEVAVGGGDDAHVDVDARRSPPTRSQPRAPRARAGAWPAASSGSSPISSRKSVPPSASSKQPGAARSAPVKAPSRGRRARSRAASRGSRAQLMRTKGPAARALARWISAATTSLPVPVSPVMSTVTSLRAARRARSKTSRVAGVLGDDDLAVRRRRRGPAHLPERGGDELVGGGAVVGDGGGTRGGAYAGHLATERGERVSELVGLRARRLGQDEQVLAGGVLAGEIDAAQPRGDAQRRFATGAARAVQGDADDGERPAEAHRALDLGDEPRRQLAFADDGRGGARDIDADLDRPGGDDVARLQRHAPLDAPPVELRAVAAAEVFGVERVLAERDAQVAARDAIVVDDVGDVARAADHRPRDDRVRR